MRLQRQDGRSYKTKAGPVNKYPKWLVVIPPEMVEALGWEKGLRLIPQRKGDALILKPEVNRGS